MLSAPKTTGQMRELLAKAAADVMNGTMSIESANALHKVARNISDSLYSETKIAMLNRDLDHPVAEFGELFIGDRSTER